MNKNFISRIGLCLCFSLAALVAQAQFVYSVNQSIDVEVNGKKLSLPWAGGFNSAQFNTMDLNGDGKQDLVVFDRTANKLITFLNKSNQYEYAPEYEPLFPIEVSQWVLLRDLNCDGKKDLFTSDPFGIVVFVNITKAGEPLKWRSYSQPGFPLLTSNGTNNFNLKVNASDIPAIDDIDGDGDLDVLNLQFVGAGIEYHKNFSIERTGKCDSLQLERATKNFGGFEECSCGNFAFGKTCASGGRTQHAGGKALLTFDMDNDGDRELLFSEENCSQLFLLPNTGTKDNAVMESALLFPSSRPVNLRLFPAPFIEDVDFDDVADLVVSPNTYSRTFQNIDFENSAWFYKNNGTKALPVFSFNRQDLLQGEMIEVGDNAVPAFFDHDGDGDLDMYVGNYANNNFLGSISLFENTGTPFSTSFKYITSDLYDLTNSNLYNFKPQFADINSDGTFDLILTASNPQNGGTGLLYIPNRSKTSLDISGQQLTPIEFNMGQNENISFADINQDGLTDILLGKSTGALQYWKNEGPAGSFNFSLENGSYLGLGSSTERQNPATVVADLNADGKADLVMGDQRGAITIFSDFRNQSAPSTGVKNIISNPFTKINTSKNLGGRVWPTVANLFNNDKPAIIVGTAMGGIQILKNDEANELTEIPVIDLYPNPVSLEESFSIRPDRNVQVQFFSLLGQRVSGEYQLPANVSYPFVLEGLASGLYIARFSVNGKTYGKKFIIR